MAWHLSAWAPTSVFTGLALYLFPGSPLTQYGFILPGSICSQLISKEDPIVSSGWTRTWSALIPALGDFPTIWLQTKWEATLHLPLTQPEPSQATLGDDWQVEYNLEAEGPGE